MKYRGVKIKAFSNQLINKHIVYQNTTKIVLVMKRCYETYKYLFFY